MNALALKPRLHIAQYEAKANISRMIDWTYLKIASLIMALVYCIVPVFAANNIFTEMTTNLRDVYNSIFPLITVVALICFLIALGTYLMATDEKAAGRGKEWAKRIFFAWLIASVAPWLFVMLRNLLGNSVNDKNIDDVTNIINN